MMTKALRVSKCFSSIIVAVFTLAALLPIYSAYSREMIDFPRVKLQTLDKATARTMTFNAKVGSTVRFGPLYIRIQSCQKASPIDQPESAAFLQVWEVDTEDKAQWVFSGWMFASSPGLSPMDHPIYDVWVLDCLDFDKVEGAEETESKEGGDESTALEKSNPNDAKNQDLLE